MRTEDTFQGGGTSTAAVVLNGVHAVPGTVPSSRPYITGPRSHLGPQRLYQGGGVRGGERSAFQGRGRAGRDG